MRAEVLLTEPRWVTLPAGHRLAAREEISFDQLWDEPLVAGPSMKPTLTSGDRILVRRVGMSKLRPGLIVVVERPRLGGGWAGSPPGWPPDRRPADVPSPGSDPDDGMVPPGMFVVLGDNAAWRPTRIIQRKSNV